MRDNVSSYVMQEKYYFIIYNKN